MIEICAELKKHHLVNNLVTAAGHNFIYKMVEKHIIPGQKVIDWGCESGYFSYFLLSKGLNVTAYNIVDNMPSKFILQEKWKDTFNYVVSSEPKLLPFESNSFDAVFSIGVLEHVRETGGNELSSLLELQRILRPKGKLFCFHLPNKFSWIEYFSRNQRGKYHHIYLYTMKDIHDLLKQTNLQLLDTGKYNFLPRNVLNNLPEFVKNEIWFYSTYNKTDQILTSVLPFFTQNLYFIAEKL